MMKLTDEQLSAILGCLAALDMPQETSEQVRIVYGCEEVLEWFGIDSWSWSSSVTKVLRELERRGMA